VPVPVVLVGAAASGGAGVGVDELVLVVVGAVVVVAGGIALRRLGVALVRVRRRGAVSVTCGANPRDAETGSEDSPMCWLVSWLVAQVTPAASAIPATPARIHRTPWRLTKPTLAVAGLRLGKVFRAGCTCRS